MKKLSHVIAVLTLAWLSPLAHAQDESADKLIAGALVVIEQVDANKAEAVWDGAAPFVKARLTRAELGAQLARSRAAAGSVFQRTWASVNRVRYDTAATGIPPGVYANVDFSTRLSDGRTVFELVSFRQETDGNWLVTGYVLRQTQ